MLHGRGPLVLAAHGFPDCATTFQHQVSPLVEAGLSVALVSMRGYFPSSRSRLGRYDASALGADLLAVADALSPAAPVGIVGHDWGAVAGFAASARAPERIGALATLAVPHLRVAAPRFFSLEQARRSRYILDLRRAGAEARLRARDFAAVDALWRNWSPGFVPPSEHLAAVKHALAAHPEGPLAYYRSLFPPDPTSVRWLAAKTRVPSLHLHGRDDGCIGVDLCAGVERAYADAFSLVVVEGAGHFLHLERPDTVNAVLVRFLADRLHRK